MSTQSPTPRQSIASTEYRIIGVVVSYDVTYDGERPVYVRPIVCTSAGFQVRLTNGGQPLDHDDEPTRHFRVSTDEKLLGLLPAQGRLVMLTPKTDENPATWEFRSEGA